jgi:hypothetical protein
MALLSSATGCTQRDTEVMALVYEMMGNIEVDLQETRSNLSTTRKLNADLEKLVQQQSKMKRIIENFWRLLKRLCQMKEKLKKK